MRSQFDDGGGNGPDVNQILEHVSDTLRRNMRRLGPIAGVVILILIAGTGFYSVGPGEQGVVRTFGRETGKTAPGLHYRIPIIQKKDVVNVEQIRRIEVGFRGQQRVPDEALMLTGDENIVEAQMIVQYRVKEPTKFLFRLKNPEQVLRTTAEVALRSMVGRTTIDDVITTGREQVQEETHAWLQTLMDKYQSGLTITDVKLQTVDAPDEVKEAFHDVVRAREDKEKLINQAKGYKADIIPKARGEAQKIERAAEGYKEQRVLRAKGDAARFDSLLAEYTKAEKVTRERMYLETMGSIMSKVGKKIIVDRGLAKGVLPILPLGRQAIGALTAKGGK